MSLDGWSVQYHSGGATGSLAGHAAERLDRARRHLPGRRGARAPAARSRCPPTQATGTIADVRHRRHGRRSSTTTTALTCADSAACQSRIGRPRRLRHGGASARRRPATGASNTDVGAAQGRRRQRRQRRRLRGRRPDARRRQRAAAATADRRRRARPAAHPRHPGLELARRRTTASRSPTCPASSPASARPAAAAATGSRTRLPTRARPPARASSSSPPRPGVGGRRLACSCPARSRTSTRCPAATRSTTTSNLSVTEIGTPDGHRALARQRAAGARGHHAGHGARHLRPGPRRRQHRVDADHPDPLGAGLLGVARGHARRRSTTPAWSARPTASASSSSPPSRRRRRTYRGGTELLAENADPVGPHRGRAGRTAPTPASSVGDVFQRRDGRARSTTRSSAATLIAATHARHGPAQRPAARRRDRRRAPSSSRWRRTTSRTSRPATPPRSTSASPRASSPTWPSPTSSRSRRCRTTPAPPTTASSRPTRR